MKVSKKALIKIKPEIRYTGQLLNTLKKHDYATFLHSYRVSDFSVYLGRQIKLTEAEINQLAIAALLHDIGKIKIPLNLLHKTEQLNAAEWEKIKRHSQYGASILIKYPIIVHQDIINCVYYHHERYSANGYPSGLKGEEIPIYARVVAVADALDAMLNPRPYRKTPLSYDEAIGELQIHAGTQFDPYIVNILKGGF